MITIPYTDERITYIGRFLTPITGMQSGWQSSQIRFKVKGTTKVIITADIKDSQSTSEVLLLTNVDNVPLTTKLPLSTVSEIFTGERTATINLPDTNEHLILFKTSPNGVIDQYELLSYIRIKSISIDDGGTLLPWVQSGSKLIMTIGDSWMAGYHDWVRFLNPIKYKIYPIAYGGVTTDQIDVRFPYQALGVTKNDPVVDGVIIGLGVNDYWSGFTVATHKGYMSSLIDKVRASQPNAKIFLLQIPRNISAGKLYDSYGVALQELVNEKENVTYISTESIWETLTWLSDTSHLDGLGRQKLANYVSTQINPYYFLPEGSYAIKAYINGSIHVLPTYDLYSILDSNLRIALNNEIKCFKLVDVDDTKASMIRVNTINGIKSISL